MKNDNPHVWHEVLMFSIAIKPASVGVRFNEIHQIPNARSIKYDWMI